MLLLLLLLLSGVPVCRRHAHDSSHLLLHHPDVHGPLLHEGKCSCICTPAQTALDGPSLPPVQLQHHPCHSSEACDAPYVAAQLPSHPAAAANGVSDTGSDCHAMLCCIQAAIHMHSSAQDHMQGHNIMKCQVPNTHQQCCASAVAAVPCSVPTWWQPWLRLGQHCHCMRCGHCYLRGAHRGCSQGVCMCHVCCLPWHAGTGCEVHVVVKLGLLACGQDAAAYSS
jgi:hypothetical protein